jgi:hypothetical protein
MPSPDRAQPPIGSTRTWRAIALTAAVGTVVVLVLAHSRHHPQTSVPAAAGSRAGTEVRLSLFERPLVAQDSVSPRARRWLVKFKQLRFTKSDVRSARRAVGEAPVWVLPSSSGVVCLLREQSALGRMAAPSGLTLSCVPKRSVAAGRLLLSGNGLAAHTRGPFVLGVLPNGVKAATLLFAGGKRRALAVRRNIYFAREKDLEAVIVTVDGVGLRLPVAVPDGPEG